MEWRGLLEIEGTGCAGAWALDDVEVDHGGGDIGVTKEVLNGPDVGSGFEQMRGKRMSEGMAGDAFVEIGLAHGLAELAGHGVVVEVVFCEFAGSGVSAQSSGWKQPVPRPLAGGVGKFTEERFRDVHIRGAGGEILIEALAECGEVILEAAFDGPRQWDDAVFAAFAIMDGDGALAEIEVFDAEFHAFHEAHAGAIHELGCEFPWIFEVVDDAADLFASHDGGWPSAATGAGIALDGEISDAEDVFDEEGNGVESLVLGGFRNIALKREVIEVGRDGCDTRVLRRNAEAFMAEAGIA